MATQEFINRPDTVDFIVQDSQRVTNILDALPQIQRGPSLTGGYVIVYASQSDVEELSYIFGENVSGYYSVALTLMDTQSLSESGITLVQSPSFLNLRGQGVLIGFVDTGIDYTSEAFIYEDGTSKIRFLWDQSADTFNPPEEFLYGEEYTNGQINEALLSEDPLSVVPEQDTVGHGTFMASVAASRLGGEYGGAAPDADLIVVKLRRARPFYYEEFFISTELENIFESNDVVQGVEYIYRRAQELNMPVVICLGLGTNLGGHDGGTVFENYLGAVSQRVGVCICSAAGNESQARHHTQGIIASTGERRNIELRVDGEDGNVYMTIWNTAADRISISVQSPTGERVGPITARNNTLYQTQLTLESSRVGVQYFFPVESSGSQLSIVKISSATPGLWTITLIGDSILDGTYHAWLPVTGMSSIPVEFLAPSPDCTVVVPSTTLGVITCGGYNVLNNSLYISSSWGPTRQPALSPDLVAPCVNVSGIYSDGPGISTGTSIASAITAGACALIMQWGFINENDTSLNTYRIRALLIRGCDRDQPITYPNNQWGYGELNLFNTFIMIRGGV